MQFLVLVGAKLRIRVTIKGENELLKIAKTYGTKEIKKVELSFESLFLLYNQHVVNVKVVIVGGGRNSWKTLRVKRSG